MSEWVVVNGARIEKTYFEVNVSEARSLAWDPATWDKTCEHAHCLVCGLSISADKPKCFRSDNAWLCLFCFQHYIATDDQPGAGGEKRVSGTVSKRKPGDENGS